MTHLCDNWLILCPIDPKPPVDLGGDPTGRVWMHLWSLPPDVLEKLRDDPKTDSLDPSTTVYEESLMFLLELIPLCPWVYSSKRAMRYSWICLMLREIIVMHYSYNSIQLINNTLDIDDLTETITWYVKLNVDIIHPKKKIKVFSINKPWIRSNLWQHILLKHGAFSERSSDMTEIQRSVNHAIWEAKHYFKANVEGKV